MAEISREAILLAAGGRAILLQIAMPAIGHGVARHSDFDNDPLRRLHGTLGYVYALATGSEADKAAVRRAVNRAHVPVRSATDADPAYNAMDPALQLWVAATLYESALSMYERIYGTLSAEDADAIYAEYAILGTALGLSISGATFGWLAAHGDPARFSGRDGTLAGDDAEQTSALAAALAGPSFRPYAADDRIGVEIAGALKNVYALACGAVDGAGLGASARSALLARGYAEMARLVTAMGGSATTLTGLAGLGDLTLTCTSVQSRNYQFGMALGRGESVEAIIAGGAKLAEGVATTPVADALARSLGVEAPLIVAMHDVLRQTADIATIVAGLMSRPLKRED